MTTEDDGVGASAVIEGHGLTGMRERFAEFGGIVEFITAPGQGFRMQGYMPRVEQAP